MASKWSGCAEFMAGLLEWNGPDMQKAVAMRVGMIERLCRVWYGRDASRPNIRFVSVGRAHKEFSLFGNTWNGCLGHSSRTSFSQLGLFGCCCWGMSFDLSIGLLWFGVVVRLLRGKDICVCVYIYMHICICTYVYMVGINNLHRAAAHQCSLQYKSRGFSGLRDGSSANPGRTERTCLPSGVYHGPCSINSYGPLWGKRPLVLGYLAFQVLNNSHIAGWRFARTSQLDPKRTPCFQDLRGFTGSWDAAPLPPVWVCKRA